MKWRVILEPDLEIGGWTVWCPELPGCISEGESEQEALNNIREAIQLYLEPHDLGDELSSNAIVKEVFI
jgi:predicted RNase H-like HicB family nuclease